jgi:transcriptional regulator with XRE-family HTH domain
MSKLRDLRLAKGMTLKDVASRAETTPTQISRLETGKRHLDTDWLLKLAEVLEVRVEDILEDANHPLLMKRLGDLPPVPKAMEFVDVCFQTVIEFRDASSSPIRDFMGPETCFAVAYTMARIFFPIFDTSGITKELYLSRKVMCATHVGIEADKAGQPHLADAAERRAGGLILSTLGNLDEEGQDVANQNDQ